jgi:hypothetical protein
MLHIHACCKYMFRVFSGVSYVCLQVFHLDVAYFTMICNCFSSVFASVLNVCFKCFICLLLYVATVASRCFKGRLGVARRMRVGSGRRRGTTTGALPHEPDTLGAHSLPVRVGSGSGQWHGRRPRVAQDNYWCAPSQARMSGC